MPSYYCFSGRLFRGPRFASSSDLMALEAKRMFHRRQLMKGALLKLWLNGRVFNQLSKMSGSKIE